MREIQLADFINHIQTDMGPILKVLERPSVFEVMLNAYHNQNGTYEGHIWYEEAGVGMQRLTSETIHELNNYPKPKVGDKLLVKKYNEQILCWHVLNKETPENKPQSTVVAPTIINVISALIKNNIESFDNNVTFILKQSLNYELHELSDNIKHYNKFHYKDEDTFGLDLLANDDLFIHQVNIRIQDLDEIFHFEIIEATDEILSTLNYPTLASRLVFEKMTEAKARQIMGILASATSQVIHEQEPTLECSIPFYGHRFTGVIPPATAFPTMCIRKHSSKVISLDDYVKQGVMTQECRETIKHWVKNHFNILIAGGTGSGKTTMANAILREIKRETPQDRVGIIEDTPELQCTVANYYKFTKTNERDMQSLLRTNLRYRPDRIIVGEIRGKEAYVLLKAWMSGHPGGLATIHANGAREATHRFEQCISESPEAGVVPRDQIAYAVNGIISIQKVTLREERDGLVQFVVKRKVTALRQINGYDARYNKYIDLYPYQDNSPFSYDKDEEKPSTENYLE